MRMIKPESAGALMERMRDVLRSSLAASLASASAEDRVAAAWPVVCGAAVAGRARVVGYDAGVLRVQVAGAAWLAQMQSMRPRLLRELTRIAGAPLTDILFLVGDDI